MNCSEVAELLPAYALNAVSEDERAQIEEHLASCGLHAEALEFERVAARLPEAIAEREPPADLRDRILTSSRDTAASPDATRDSGIAWYAERESTPTAVPTRSSWIVPRFVPYAIAAAVAVLMIGFVSLTVFTGSDGTQIREATNDDGVSTRLAYNAGDQSADISFQGLPALEANQTYQLWTIGPDSAPVSAGLLDRLEDGTASTSISGSFEDGTTFAITVEPAGGSDQPTTDPLIATTL